MLGLNEDQKMKTFSMVTFFGQILQQIVAIVAIFLCQLVTDKLYELAYEQNDSGFLRDLAAFLLHQTNSNCVA